MSSSRQRLCKYRPPCKSRMSEYKMRKSRGRCCRKKSHKRIGPTKPNPWVKFLRSHEGRGLSRKKLRSVYRSSKKRSMKR